MSKNKNSKTVTAKKGAGRPRAIVTLPLTKKFTFPDICACNGCTPLTIRKWLKRDMFVTDSDGEYVLDKAGNKQPRRNSLVLLVRGETMEPNAKSKKNEGLGRRVLVYTKRASAAKAKSKTIVKPVSVPVVNVAPAAPVSVPVTVTPPAPVPTVAS